METQEDKCLEKKCEFSFRLTKFKETDVIIRVPTVDKPIWYITGSPRAPEFL